MVAPVFISGRTNLRALKSVPLFSNSYNSACGFILQLGISLVYWLNLFKTHYSPIHARLGVAKIYSIVYRVLVCWIARGAHLRPMRFPKRARRAMAATAQDAHTRMGNRA